MTAQLRERPDRHAIRVVQAAYRLENSAEDWMEDVLQAARPLLDCGLGLLGARFRLTEQGTVRLHADPIAAGPVPPTAGDVFRTMGESLPPEFVRLTWADPQALDTSSGVFHRHQPTEDFGAAPVMRPCVEIGVHDTLVAKMVDANRAGFLFCAPMRRAELPTLEYEPRWRLVMTHLLAGLRLRMGLHHGDGDAVVSADGRVEHAEADARSSSARDALRRAAIAIDRARSSAGARDPDAALQAWHGLVSGRWSLVDRFDSDGRRFLVARRNDPVVSSPRALSERERQIAAYAALGHTNKRIAYTLGLAPSTVSSHLQAALRRLGARDIAALAEIFRGLARDEDQRD